MEAFIDRFTYYNINYRRCMMKVLSMMVLSAVKALPGTLVVKHGELVKL